jgi:esterase/lipase superfamily enzyme
MWNLDRNLGVGLVCLSLLLTACAGPRKMMPTPNVHLDQNRDFYGELHPSLKSTEVPLFFITDRAPEQDEQGNLRYGHNRSNSLAFGTAVVDLGRDITWEELVEASRTQQRLKSVHLELRDVKEIVRGPGTPLPYAEIDGKIVERPDLARQNEDAKEALRRVMVEQLNLTPRKEVFIYVHGYHNSFEDAAFGMAELWHFMGRIGVPIIYTWPAGYPGLFGYTYDRESSEFTVYHLRKVLGLLASIPEVEKIHLIAHSRGTDVAVTALRELTLQIRAKGKDPKEELKIHNIILAAPDLDLQVAEQRMVGDRLAETAHRFTVYTSPKDKAIGVAAKLFASPRGRLGTLGLEQLPETVTNTIEYGTANFSVVNFEGATDATRTQGDRYGHSYFRDAPTVSSDVVLTIREDLDPGTPGRPLEPLGHKFWRVPPGYPNP